MPGRTAPQGRVGATDVGVGGQGGGLPKPTSQLSLGPISPVMMSLNCAELTVPLAVTFTSHAPMTSLPQGLLKLSLRTL